MSQSCPVPKIPAPVPDRSSPSPEAQFNSARVAFFKEEGVAAVWRDSGKLYGLLTMTSVGGSRFEIGAVPTAMLTHEDYCLVWRLLQHAGASRLGIQHRSIARTAPAEFKP